MTEERENEIARAFVAAGNESNWFRDVPDSAMRQTVWEATYKRCPCTEAELTEVLAQGWEIIAWHRQFEQRRRRARLSIVK